MFSTLCEPCAAANTTSINTEKYASKNITHAGYLTAPFLFFKLHNMFIVSNIMYIILYKTRVNENIFLFFNE